MSAQENRKARIGKHTNTHTHTHTHKTRDTHADRLGSHADRLHTHPQHKNTPPHTHYTVRDEVDRTDFDSRSRPYTNRQKFDRSDLDIVRTERDSHRTDRVCDGRSHKYHLRSHQRFVPYVPSDSHNHFQSKPEQKACLSSQQSANDHGFSHKFCAFCEGADRLTAHT